MVESKRTFAELYKAGEIAFDRGEYRGCIKQLTAALEEISPQSLQGGQAQLKLVYAYQGLGEGENALDLCRALTTHPSYDVRDEAKQLLYILEAPRLKRPEQWMSKIPDLDQLPESPPQYKKGTNLPKKEETPIEPMNLDKSQNYSFIIFALLIISVSFGLFFLFSRVN
ncbi:MAG: hypothetical protein N5P05_003390 [Chroococcopsis gigantea SAG 12.99]|jgi:hypothetical protein|nr:outer membrane protein assembly factor BamD [Chlorogloea purpurea SAG 13.99]MDV3001784.1 hypothetical protein [Chroococcopsis gigantea SAG 12.99]